MFTSKERKMMACGLIAPALLDFMVIRNSFQTTTNSNVLLLIGFFQMWIIYKIWMTWPHSQKKAFTSKWQKKALTSKWQNPAVIIIFQNFIAECFFIIIIIFSWFCTHPEICGNSFGTNLKYWMNYCYSFCYFSQHH